MPVNYLHPHLHCNEQEPAYMHTSPLPNTHTRQTNLHMNTKFKKKRHTQQRSSSSGGSVGMTISLA